MLKNHSWPGNFKQMEQVLSYLISINTSGIITEEDVLRLPDFKQNDGPFNLKEQERQLIQKALQRFTGPYGKQAAELTAEDIDDPDRVMPPAWAGAARS